MRTFGGGAILSVVLVSLAIGAQACSPDPQPPGSTPSPSPSPLPPSRVFTTRDGVRFQVETVLTGLEIPWSLAFAPDGRLFVTERPGGQQDGEHHKDDQRDLQTLVFLSGHNCCSPSATSSRDQRD